MNSDSSPTRSAFVGSIALVRRLVGESEEWLGIWDETSGTFRLPHANRGEHETFRSCLHAVIEEELELNRKNDYIISGLSRKHFQAPIEWPGETVPQWVIVEFFTVDLYGRTSRAAVDRLPNVRWISLREMARGWTSDGYRICDHHQTLIRRADLLPASVTSD